MNYICRLIKINAANWYLYVVGFVTAMYVGAIFPVFAFLLSRIIVTISGIENSTGDDLVVLQQDVYILSITLFFISISALLVMSFRGVSFVYLTENLGYTLKNNAFRVSINRPMKEVDEIGKQKLAHIVNTNC
jgi:ABC-type multidrug transport system fused ATPase/permease subunit